MRISARSDAQARQGQRDRQPVRVTPARGWRPTRGGSSRTETNGHVRIDRAEDVVRDDDRNVLRGATVRVIAPRDRAAKNVLLELRVSPRPAVLGGRGALPVEQQRALVGGTRWGGGARRVLPVRLTRQQPYGAVVRRAVGLRLQLGGGVGVVQPALDEVLHSLVVLPVPNRRGRREGSA